MSIYERDNSNKKQVVGSGCFPYCLMSLGATIYWIGYNNKYNLF